MDEQRNLANIFLSASIPSEDRDKVYFETADVIAIRDSVRALATVVIPNCKLIWGGHPAITPLIHYVMNRMGSSVKDHIILYQSQFFEKFFPPDNEFFEDVRIIGRKETRELSLEAMRYEMIAENKFSAGIFIGGMEGVEDEYNLFKEYHPETLALPVASTGAAAKLIYERMENRDKRLQNDYAYMNLFKKLLVEIL